MFTRMNLEPAVLKTFAFDWALCFRLCGAYRFQNLVGWELPIKHDLSWLLACEWKLHLANIKNRILKENVLFLRK